MLGPNLVPKAPKPRSPAPATPRPGIAKEAIDKACRGFSLTYSTTASEIGLGIALRSAAVGGLSLGACTSTSCRSSDNSLRSNNLSTPSGVRLYSSAISSTSTKPLSWNPTTPPACIPFDILIRALITSLGSKLPNSWSIRALASASAFSRSFISSITRPSTSKGAGCSSPPPNSPPSPALILSSMPDSSCTGPPSAIRGIPAAGKPII